MSRVNLFIVHTKNSNELSGLESKSNDLVKLALSREIGINFNMLGYHDDLLKLINVKYDYFCVSDSFYNLETDSLFDFNDCLTSKERIDKYSFLNKIVGIVFELPNVSYIDFYISNSYTFTLSDYKEIIVSNKDLTHAFEDAILNQAKKFNFIGVPAIKFILKNN